MQSTKAIASLNNYDDRERETNFLPFKKKNNSIEKIQQLFHQGLFIYL